MRHDIEFRTEDRVILRGWHYVPERAGPTPTVVMAHGYAAVKEMYLDRFAEAFAEAGIGAVVFDNRNFGASDGEPRQEIDPSQQIRDYRDAITWASSLPEVDAERIGIWGSSYSGAHVLVVGAIDRRVKCVVAQVPLISGHANARRLIRSDFIVQVQAACLEDRKARYQGKPPAMIPVVSENPMGPAVLPTPELLAVVHRNGSHSCACLAQRGHAALGRDVSGIRTGRAHRAYQPDATDDGSGAQRPFDGCRRSLGCLRAGAGTKAARLAAWRAF